MRAPLLFLLVAISLTACKKPENRRCWKFAGKTKTLEFALGQFDKLKLYPHIAYELVQDSLDKIEITGGANLVNLIDFSVSSSLLTVKNRNKCSFLRNEKEEIVVRIHFTNVYNIHYEGSEYLKTIGKMKADYFTLLIRDGAGPVTMDLESNIIDADISHGWGDYTFTGTTRYARISARSNGYCDTWGLSITDSVYVASDTPGHIKVRADGIPLRGYAKSSGNILYKGTPSLISVLLTGTGKVINAN